MHHLDCYQFWKILVRFFVRVDDDYITQSTG